MNSVPAGKNLSFEVSYDSAVLDVAMTVFDTTNGSPTVVQGPTAMAGIGYTYLGYFNPTAGKTYLVHKAVYTDNTFTTLHPDYSPGTETIAAVGVDIQADLVGVVLDSDLISGTVEDAEVLTGAVIDDEVLN